MHTDIIDNNVYESYYDEDFMNGQIIFQNSLTLEVLLHLKHRKN